MANRYMNCSVEAVENLYCESDWCKVFKHRKAIRIPTTCPLSIDDYIQDQPSTVWEIIDRDGVRVIENDSFFQDMNSQQNSVLSRSKDIFVVDKDTAKSYSDINTGTCVFLDDKEQLETLKIHWEKSLKTNNNYSWHNFFTDCGRSISSIPSSSLILIDRYFFASPFDAGVSNLKDLLSELLPLHFSADYHILIVADPNEFKRGKNNIVPLECAAQQINETVESIVRPYPKTIELLAVSKLDKKGNTIEDKIHFDIYNEMHNRRIFSNSFIIRAEHGFDAMKEYNNPDKNVHCIQAKHSQTIWFDAIYSGIDNKYQDFNDLPVKPCDDTIDLLRKIMGPNGGSIGRYFINGVEGHPKDIKNRLLR